MGIAALNPSYEALTPFSQRRLNGLSPPINCLRPLFVGTPVAGQITSIPFVDVAPYCSFLS